MRSGQKVVGHAQAKRQSKNTVAERLDTKSMLMRSGEKVVGHAQAKRQSKNTVAERLDIQNSLSSQLSRITIPPFLIKTF